MDNKNLYDQIGGNKKTYEESVAQAQNPTGVEAQINQYNEETGKTETVTVNRNAQASDAKLNTGSGAEAAVGTSYSWNKQGNDKANAQYQSDVIGKKQELLTNRQTIENNAVNYQAQADMMKYQNNQNADKVGWTGGYVLDQNRQMEYLKQGIQAQMYGAMELQKYGYDSALSAARLAYDLNQQEYARQYYQEAVSQALSEAQLTGTYFSAEAKDMMGQRAVAEQKLKDDPNDENAKKLVDQIDGWFEANGISKAGVKTLEAWQADQANEIQWTNEMWSRYQAALESAKNDLSENSSMFIRLDESGKEIWDGNNVTTGNWETMSGKEIFNYINGNQAAINQYYSYLDSTIVGQAEAGFTKWCQTQGLIGTDEKGNTTINTNEFTSQFLRYIQTSGIIEKIQNQFDQTEFSKEELKDLEDIMYNWDFTFQLPDGKTINKTYQELLETETVAVSANGTSSTVTVNTTDKDGNRITTDANVVSTPLQNGYVGWNTSTFYTTTLKDSGGNTANICFTTGKVTNVDDPNEANFDQDDIEVKLFKDDKDGTNHDQGYGVEVADNPGDNWEAFMMPGPAIIGWASGSADTSNNVKYTDFKTIMEDTYYAATGSTMKGGEVVVVSGKVYFYNKNGYPYSKAKDGLYGIQNQSCKGGKDLVGTLKSQGMWVD